jgi:hypothetical protein
MQTARAMPRLTRNLLSASPGTAGYALVVFNALRWDDSPVSPPSLAAGSRLLAGLFATGVLVTSAAACGSSGSLLIENIDGSAVSVVPWVGGPTVVVDCQSAQQVNTSAAPGQPWLITVRRLSNSGMLLQQTVSGDLEVIVRRGGVLIGPQAASAGPAGIGCAGA